MGFPASGVGLGTDRVASLSRGNEAASPVVDEAAKNIKSTMWQCRRLRLRF
jgi:hypothetical protein